MSEQYTLPKNWRWVKLGEVCEIISKGTTPTTYGHDFVNSGIPFLRAEDIMGGPVNFSSVTYHITKETHEFLERSKLRSGDLLITIAGTLGRVGYVPEKAPEVNCNQAVAFARVNSTEADVKFLCYFLQIPEVLSPFVELKVGGTIQNLNLQQVRSIEIPLPSLSEQKLIIAKIQALMQEVKQAKESCEKQLEASQALPSAYLREVFESPEAKKWERKRLGEVCEIRNGYAFKSNDFITEGIPVIRISDIQDNYVTSAKSIRVPKEYLETFKDFIIENGDILIAMSGATTGKVGVYTDKTVALQNQRVGKFEPNTKLILNGFLWFIVQRISQHILDQAYGSAQPNISSSDIKNFEIHIPPLSEQNRIVSELKEKMQQAGILRSKILNQQSTIDALPQAILRKAFRGELNV